MTTALLCALFASGLQAAAPAGRVAAADGSFTFVPPAGWVSVSPSTEGVALVDYRPADIAGWGLTIEEISKGSGELSVERWVKKSALSLWDQSRETDKSTGPLEPYTHLSGVKGWYFTKGDTMQGLAKAVFASGGRIFLMTCGVSRFKECGASLESIRHVKAPTPYAGKAAPLRLKASDGSFSIAPPEGWTETPSKYRTPDALVDFSPPRGDDAKASMAVAELKLTRGADGLKKFAHRAWADERSKSKETSPLRPFGRSGGVSEGWFYVTSPSEREGSADVYFRSGGRNFVMYCPSALFEDCQASLEMIQHLPKEKKP